MTSPLVSAWTKLCHHCDGIAFGTTAEALLALGAFDTIRAGAFTPASLARAFSLQSGFTAVAIKLLRSQGFAQKQGESVVLTPDGAAFTKHGDLLHGACARIHAACELLRALAGTGPAPAFT
ncbi:hypothetical protein, partial [Corallococcus exiguus]|uniref:hypothetical protein n=1 Tax=Corallococcus exiguus TaxID=83462 RepID=UPI003F66062B